ncbi:glutamate receptor, ionotropic kainate 2 precursor, putative [Pediculus humanus corporis]|uniref:Glutamate receptor 1 n=1 Tax=Pediculus humanus subsp. corporis TaxID=121224 RepID=E0W190_PEDHC|nr:glutamate receptor, ionotropic kainate 2 precursor, putative [Pediculus humanus corporis]EEB19396.1 glutamate receptor, ionotropic kainate 2 precursor, putative [Pediculus humanus corporis]
MLSETFVCFDNLLKLPNEKIIRKNKILVFCLLIIILSKNVVVSSLPATLKIGAVFTTNQKGGSIEIAFKHAVHNINKEKNLLPNTKLVYDLAYVNNNDSFHAMKKVCRQVNNLGVRAVFGPTDSFIGNHIQSIFDALDIPHLETRLDLDKKSKRFSINLHPSQELLNKAYLDLVKFLNWTRIAIVYEENNGLVKLKELIDGKSIVLDIYMRQIQKNNYRGILNGIRNRDIHNIIIDMKSNNIKFFLNEIFYLKMNDIKYHYVFTNIDVEAFHLLNLNINIINVTTFRLININDDDDDDKKIKNDFDNLKRLIKSIRDDESGDNYLNNNQISKTEPALIYDSVYVFAAGLQAFDGNQLSSSSSPSSSNVSCESEIPWNEGLSLINYINSVELKGLTGPIEFKEGERVQFKLDLLKINSKKIIKAGEWTPNGGLNITNKSIFFHPIDTNVTLVVTTILEQPYVMMKTKTNSSFALEGFCIDLLDAIANLVGFKYNISLVPDGKYGVYDYKTGEWNGMVRQLIDKKADLAVGSMTINYARESVIDFTKPFMTLGISILFKVPKNQAAQLFSFMNPLALNIWFYIFAAYALVSLTLLIVARLSPYEWQNPHVCSPANNYVINPFTMGNCFWFTVGSLMQQGSDLNPRSTSTRIVGAIWWFFTLIIISSYTANLAAFLTVERMISPIENAEDLASQTDIKYGTLESGSTMAFFRDSMIETYQKMWRFMENKKPSVFVSTYEEGIQRVLDGKYAFLMESTMLDYILQRDCSLIQIGGILDNKGYGIGTPMGSPWRDKISLAILELQEKGEIQILYDKWWKKLENICEKKKKKKDTKANSLGVVNIGGIFIVLIGGLAFAILVAIFEFCYYSKCGTSIERVSYLTVFER